MTAWNELANSRRLQLPAFAFTSGGRVSVKLHCRTLGTLNNAGDNAVLLLHGTTGSSLQFLKSETADFLFGQGQPLDQNDYFVIMPDAIGHGESSKPSDELGEDFPQYSYSDIVAAQHAIVHDLFGIDRLRLVLGTSMGGMQTWMWGIRYPKMMDALMPIACLPERLSGINLLFRRLMLAMIRSDPQYADSELSPPSHGVGLAWNLFQLMINSQARLAEDFKDPDRADRHIWQIVKEAESTQKAVDVIWEFNASCDYDPGSDLENIEAPLLSVNFSDDVINSPQFDVLNHDIQRVRYGRAVTIDAGGKAQGHQTLAHAEVWGQYVGELLTETSSPPTTQLFSKE